MLKMNISQKIKDVFIYILKWLACYAILIVPCVFLIVRLGKDNIEEWNFWVIAVRFFITGLLITLFFKSYFKGELNSITNIEETFAKTKEITVYSIKWFLYYGFFIVPCIYLILNLETNNISGGMFWSWMIKWTLVGLLLSLVCRSYLKGELKNILDFGKNSTKNQKHKHYFFFNTNMTWDTVIHWFLVIFTFVIVYWIMVEGMYSLFKNTKDILFVLLVSLVIILVQMRIVYQIMYMSGKKLWFRIGIYIILDIVIFLFNFFHFYHNISQTQRMETAVIKSKELIETVYEPISERMNTLNQQSDSVDIKKENNIKKISEFEQQLKKEQERVIYQYTGERHPDTGEALTNPRYARENQLKEQNIKKIQNQIDALINSELIESSKPEYNTLNNCKKICESIKDKIAEFNNPTSKDEQLSIKNEIVDKIIELYAILKSNQDIMILLPQDSASFHFQKEVDIIRMPDIQRVEGIGQLFDFLARQIPENRQQKDGKGNEIWKIEKRLIILSVSISALLDLIPLLLGLIYKKEEDY